MAVRGEVGTGPRGCLPSWELQSGTGGGQEWEDKFREYCIYNNNYAFLI